MASLNINSLCLLLSGVILLKNVLSFDICSGDVPQCAAIDSDCLKDTLEPQLRAWLLEDHPDFFLKGLDPMKLEKIDVKTSDNKYELKDVVITGMKDATFNNAKMEFDKKNVYYEYECTLDVTAKELQDYKGDNILSGDLSVKIDKVTINTNVETEFVTRCGNQYVSFGKVTLDVKGGDMTINGGLSDPEKGLLDELQKALAIASVRTIARDVRKIHEAYPLSTFLS